MNEIKYFVENESINDPIQYKHKSDAGMDICSNEDAIIHFGEIKMIHTGLHIQLPKNIECQVRPRSGLATQGITLVNAPGTIDEGYTGEICVILTSLNAKHNFMNGPVEDFDNGFPIHKGDRIAQLVFNEIYKVEKMNKVDSVENLVSSDNRGSDGFGSTGVK